MTESASGSFRDECSSVESPQLSADDTLEGSVESVESSESVIVGGENNMELAVSSSSSSRPLCGDVLPDSQEPDGLGLESNSTINNETDKAVENNGVAFEVEDDSQVESEVHCVVCMDEVPSRQMFTVHCESGHRFCFPCIKRHVTIALGEKKAASCLMCSHQLTQVNLQHFFLLSFFFLHTLHLFIILFFQMLLLFQFVNRMKSDCCLGPVLLSSQSIWKLKL